MISCYDSAWFCSSDFDMVSVVILIWVKIVILMWVKRVISVSFQVLYGLVCFFENKLATFQNHVRITSKSPQNRNKQYQNYIKIISQHIKTTKTPEKSTKGLSGLFPFLISNPTHREPWKRCSVAKPYQNHIKIIKSTITKSYQNHKNKSKHLFFLWFRYDFDMILICQSLWFSYGFGISPFFW